MRRDDLAWPLPNVWVGVTAEDQKRADERVPVLLELPAVVRFVSYEPACGPVDWSAWLPRRDDRLEDERCPACDGDGVVPGSSCPSLRPDHDAVEKGEFGPECAECGDAYLDEDLCRECAGTGYIDLPSLDWVICGGESGPGARPMDPAWARSARDQCEAAGVPFYFKQVGAWTFAGSNVGAKLAGRELDGRVHDGFPEER
jgi:protein gp37